MRGLVADVLARVVCGALMANHDLRDPIAANRGANLRSWDHDIRVSCIERIGASSPAYSLPTSH